MRLAHTGADVVRQTEHRTRRLSLGQIRTRGVVTAQIQQVVARATARLAPEGILKHLLSAEEILAAAAVAK